MKKTLAYLGLAFAVPFVASAQGVTQVAAQQINNLQTISSWAIWGINHIAVPFVFAAAFIVFIWGVFQTLILGKGDEEKAKAGRELIIWGIIGFVVMLSVWGLVNIVTGTFNFNNAAPPYPTTPYAP